jgi:Trm5-related predicted tRNA methylase
LGFYPYITDNSNAFIMGSLVDAQAVMNPYTLKVGDEVEKERRQEKENMKVRV